MPLDDISRNSFLPPAELLDADLSTWPWFNTYMLDRALAEVPDDIAGMARRLFMHACRRFPAGSLLDDDDELFWIAKTTLRRFKHRRAALVDILQLTKCSDGKLWVGLAVPMLIDAWNRRQKKSRDGTFGANKRWQPSYRERPANAPQKSRPDSISDPKARVSADFFMAEPELQLEEEVEVGDSSPSSTYHQEHTPWETRSRAAPGVYGGVGSEDQEFCPASDGGAAPEPFEIFSVSQMQHPIDEQKRAPIAHAAAAGGQQSPADRAPQASNRATAAPTITGAAREFSAPTSPDLYCVDGRYFVRPEGAVAFFEQFFGQVYTIEQLTGPGGPVSFEVGALEDWAEQQRAAARASLSAGRDFLALESVELLEAWRPYPIGSTAEVERRYAKARREATADQIISMARAHIANLDRYETGRERKRFCGYLANWVRRDRWRDADRPSEAA